MEDLLVDVIGFFDQQLTPVPSDGDYEFGMWRVERIERSEVLYSCSAGTRSIWQDFEGGCILLKAEGGGTLIETVWYLSGEAAQPCGPGLAVERE